MKRIAMLAVVVLLVFSLAVPVFAGGHHRGGGYARRTCFSCYNLMWDAEGGFVEKDTFEALLDDAIEDGYVAPKYKDYYLERYDYCVDNANSGFVGCGGAVTDIVGKLII